MKSLTLRTVSFVSVMYLGLSAAQAAPPPPAVNHLNQLACTAGEVAKFDGADWVCAEDVDTSAATECAAGEVLLGDGSCVANGSGLAGQGCSAGEAMTGVDQDGNVICTPLPGVLIAKDGNGDPIGTVAGYDLAAISVTVMTPQGYLAKLSPQLGQLVSGMLRQFEMPNCLGPVYVQSQVPAIVKVAADNPGDYNLYYIPRNAEYEQVTLQSRYLGGNAACANVIDPEANVLIALPNDPQVTGIQNTPYVAPITIERQP